MEPDTNTSPAHGGSAREDVDGRGRIARRVVVIGWQGATFDLLDPWVREGRMPGLRALLARGTRGVLTSTHPTIAATAWATFLTGTGPGHHGICDERLSPWADPRRPFASLADVAGEKLWERLNRHGRTTGLFLVPLTHPPEPLDGFLVTRAEVDGAACLGSFPEPLSTRLLRRIRGKTLLERYDYDPTREEDALALLEESRQVTKNRGEALLWLLREHPCDLTVAVFSLPDRLQHLFWEVLSPARSALGNEPHKRVRLAALDGFRELDRTLGEVVELLGPDDLLILLSDHGFGGQQRVFQVNRFLGEKGFLRNTPAVRAQVARTRMGALLYPERLRTILPRGLPGLDWARPRARTFPPQDEAWGVFRHRPFSALSLGVASQGIYALHPDGIRRRMLLTSLADQLMDLVAADGQSVFEWVRPREEVMPGPRCALAPDLLFQTRAGVLARSDLGAPGILETTPGCLGGQHRPEGILVLHGAGCLPGATIEGARLEDLAPTICRALGVPPSPTHQGKDLLA